MKLKIAWIGRTRERNIAALTAEYLKRISRYAPAETLELAAEGALLKHANRTFLVLLHSGGRQLTSEQFAQFIADHQNRGTPTLMFAIGPADGWSDATLQASQMQFSLGPMTIAHELARVLLLEQIYRAFTILQGHPYHLGH